MSQLERKKREHMTNTKWKIMCALASSSWVVSTHISTHSPCPRKPPEDMLFYCIHIHETPQGLPAAGTEGSSSCIIGLERKQEPANPPCETQPSWWTPSLLNWWKWRGSQNSKFRAMNCKGWETYIRSQGEKCEGDSMRYAPWPQEQVRSIGNLTTVPNGPPQSLKFH